MAEIKELKEAVEFFVAFADAVDESLEGGLNWQDVFNLVPAMTKLPAAISGAEEIPEELYDLDDAERKEIVDAIEAMDFGSDISEEIAEQSLVLVLEIGKLVTLIRKAKQ